MCSAIFHSVQQGKAKSQPPVNLVLHLKPEGALYSVYLILLFENAVSVGHRLSVREMARITRTFNIANGRKNESSDGYHIYIPTGWSHKNYALDSLQSEADITPGEVSSDYALIDCHRLHHLIGTPFRLKDLRWNIL